MTTTQTKPPESGRADSANRRTVAQHLSALVSGFASLVATVFLVAGIPYLLIWFVGNPLPTELPDLDLVSWYLTNGGIPDRFWIGLFAIVLWGLWAQLLVGFITELWAALRGLHRPSLPGVGWAQSLVGPLAARIAMTVSVLGATPGIAGAAAPLTALTQETSSSTVSPIATFTNQTPVTSDASLTPTPVEVDDAVRVVVGRRDSLRSLAAEHLDSAARWAEIRDANLGATMVDGTVINSATVSVQPGWTLRIPNQNNPEGTDAVGTDPQGSEQTVVVEEGDHFWKLAKQTLTDAWGREPNNAELTPYWFEMVEANSDKLLPPGDPNLVYTDQVFLVPAPPRNPDAGPASDFSATEALTPRVKADAALTEPVSDPTVVADTPTPVPTTAVPAVTTPPLAVQTRELGEVPTTETDRGDIAAKALLVGVSVLVVGLLRLSLVKLRKRRAAARSVGQRIDIPKNVAAAEDQIRAIEIDGADARYLAAVNPWLTKTLTNQTILPRITALRAGATGLELLLSEPAVMPQEWQPISDNDKAWRLHSNITDRHMEAESAGAFNYCPALLPVGYSPAGEVFLDTETFGALSLQGPTEPVAGLLRSMIVGALSVPWTRHCDIVVIGVDGLEPLADSRIFTPKDPQAWAKRQATLATQDAANNSISPAEARVNNTVEDYPTIVFVGASHAGVAQYLQPAAQLRNSALILITATGLTSEATILVDDSHATLEPAALRWELRPADVEDLIAVDLVVSDASKPIPVVLSEAAPILSSSAEPLPEPTPEIVQQITEILTPKDFEVRVLLDQPQVANTVDPTASIEEKQQAVITYVVLNPGHSADKVRDCFWAPKENRGATNSLGAINRLLGNSAEGSQRFVRTKSSYTITDVGCDWQRFLELTQLVASTEHLGDRAALLDAALDLVEGAPSTRTQTHLWGWLTEDSLWFLEFERVIVDAAECRARIAIGCGNIADALKAIQVGRTVGGPESEAMLRVALETTALVDTRKMQDEYLRGVALAEEDGVNLSAETHALYQRLHSSLARS